MPGRPPAPLSRAVIVAAAAGVLVNDGYDALSMRTVAARLGVKASALYWHVHNKSDLRLLLFDALVDTVVYPPLEGPWERDLCKAAEVLKTFLLETKSVSRLLLDADVDARRPIKFVERVLGILRPTALHEREGLHAYGHLISFIVGWVRLETVKRAKVARGEIAVGTASGEISNLGWSDEAAKGLFEPEDDFGYGLLSIVNGLRARMAAVKSEPPLTSTEWAGTLRRTAKGE